jgi:hypothetical protein
MRILLLGAFLANAMTEHRIGTFWKNKFIIGVKPLRKARRSFILIDQAPNNGLEPV